MCRRKEEKEMLYTNTWTNTGMPNQPTWVYNAQTQDATLGEKVGDYCAISSDMRRVYKVQYNDCCVEHRDFCYYPTQDEEIGLCTDTLCCAFIDHCEEVFNDGRAFVLLDEIAENMLDMSERLGLGWVSEEWYDTDTYEDFTVIYSAEFAKKAHIGEKAVYCFSEETMHEEVHRLAQEGYAVTFSGEEEDVIMIYPDGSYEEDKAYVVTWEDVK